MRALACLLVFAAAAAAQPFEDLFPEETILYVSLSDLERTRETFRKSPLSAAWKDPAVEALFRKEQALSKFLEDLVGVDLKQVWSVLRGQCAFGFTGLDESGGLGGALSMADIGDREEDVRRIVRRLEGEDARREEEEFRGVTIVRYVREDGTSGDDCWAIDGRLLLFGNEEALKAALVRRENGERTLSGASAFGRIRARLGARPDALVFFDMARWLDLLKKRGDLNEEIERVLAATGLRPIREIGWRLQIGPRLVESKFFLGVEGKKTGILRLFGGKNTALEPPAYAPVSAVTAGSFRLEVAELTRELDRCLELYEKGLSTMRRNFFAGLKEQTGVDFDKDILGSLGDELTFHIELPPKPPEAGDVSPLTMYGGMAIAMEVEDGERLRTALSRVAPFIGATEETYLGVAIYHRNFGDVPAVYAVLPDKLVFCIRAESIKEVIARQGKELKSFRDRADYAAAVAGLPGCVYLSVNDEAKAPFQSLWFGNLRYMAIVARELLGASVFDAPFPSAEVLGKYLGLSTTCIVNEEDGLSHTWTVHLKPQEKDD